MNNLVIINDKNFVIELDETMIGYAGPVIRKLKEDVKELMEDPGDYEALDTVKDIIELMKDLNNQEYDGYLLSITPCQMGGFTIKAWEDQ